MDNKLFKAIKMCESEHDFISLMQTTFTAKELEMLEERWQIFNSLAKGLPHRAVATLNECSIATVTRGAKTYRENKPTIDKYLKFMFNE